MTARFRFWTVTLAALLGVSATASLGFWQLGRAAQKTALQAALDDKNSLPTLVNNDFIAMKNIANEIHRPIHLLGQWLPDRTVFLDNRQMNARQGFYVMTPLRLSGSDQAILVQRGWVSRHFQDRSALPALPTPTGEVQVRGRLAPPPAKLYAFSGPEQGAIRQNLELAAFAAEIGQPLLAASLVQTQPIDAADAKALLRDWSAPNTGVDRHHGYAAQWFALAALIASLYVWFQFIAPHRAPNPAH